jgi:Xaa-Pro dipeptidase
MDRATFGPFVKAEFDARIRGMAAMMEKERLDALLCYASKIVPGSVRYLTGYETRLGIHDATYFLAFPGSASPYTLFSNASWEHPEEESWCQSVVTSSDFGNEITKRLNSSVSRLGVVGYQYLPLPVYLAVKNHFPGIEVIDATEPMMRVRAVKSIAEVEVLRQCAKITDCGGKAFLESVRPGAMERNIAATVESFMKRNGCDEVSYTTQVSCGERTSRVVTYPGDEVVREGDPVQLDCGATYLGYRGDFSRVAVVGHPNTDYQQMLEATAEMYFRILEGIRPGVLSSELSRIGIEVAKSHHLDEYLYRSPNHQVGFMGHGIGCHYHDYPDLNPHDQTVLQENMVIVVEPILMRPGLGGVKIEDAVVVTLGGAERLSSCEVRTWEAGD